MNISKFFQPALTLAFGVLLAASAFAQSTADRSPRGSASIPSPATKADTVAMSDGEVKKIDMQAQTMTLKHGPIANIGMSAMTMVFKVKTPALLSKAKPGDKVKFRAEMPNGALTIVALEPVR
jgi:Cu(I)/Ag(I) efflux system protein CusF